MDPTEDFFEEDETLEERRTAWKNSVRSRTAGIRDLNQRARSIVDQAIARFEDDGDDLRPEPTIRTERVALFGELVGRRGYELHSDPQAVIENRTLQRV